jgi:molybdate transport system substrate-binding protein
MERSDRRRGSPSPASRHAMKRLLTPWLCLAAALSFSAAARAQDQTTTEILVCADAPLRDAFRETAQAFEKRHPQARIRFNFAASGVLVEQIERGAPVALFATASVDDVRRLAQNGWLQREVPFAYNAMVLLVAHDAKERISDLADLAAPSVRLVVTARQLPAGRDAAQVLQKADLSGRYGADFSQRVLARKVSEEMDVRRTAMKVALGEGDAALVHRTDVTEEIRSRVQALPLPEDLSPRIEFRVALLQAGAQDMLATGFFLFLLSEQAQAILLRHGFQPVPFARTGPAAGMRP